MNVYCIEYVSFSLRDDSDEGGLEWLVLLILGGLVVLLVLAP